MKRCVELHPQYFGAQVHHMLKKKLYSEVEGVCNGRYGFIISVVSINNISPGRIIPGSGFAQFTIKFTATVLRPVLNEQVVATVTQVNKIGIFAEIGPLSCFISRFCLSNGLQFDSLAAPLCYKSENDEIRIKEGDRIRIRLIGTRVDATEIFAIGSMMDDYLGLVAA